MVQPIGTRACTGGTRERMFHYKSHSHTSPFWDAALGTSFKYVLPVTWRIKRINKDMQLILYSPESLGNTYLKDNISQYIRMQNNQMIICEEISAPPVDLTDIFATRMYATTSTSVWFQSSPLCYNGWTPTSWDELAGKLVELFQRLLWLSFRMDQALISH